MIYPEKIYFLEDKIGSLFQAHYQDLVAPDLDQKTAFKNVEFKDESEISKLTKAADVPVEFLDAKRIPAGWIIDQLGLKNYKIGGAEVSDKHASFIINAGDATADDVVQLVAFIKTRARNEFGINLQEEVQYVGF